MLNTGKKRAGSAKVAPGNEGSPFGQIAMNKSRVSGLWLGTLFYALLK